ncbi:MAG: biotin--[acetyl-CoA-carboxylase] ligase [Bacteroidales bacterium]
MNSDYNYIFLPVMTSTNDYLKNLFRDKPDIPEFTFVSTGFQTGGRGQRGNTWESQPGKNLMFSLLLLPSELRANKSFVISKIISISIVNVLSRYSSGFSIKWPNDIYWKDKKICGILIENYVTQEYIDSSIIGIGINVNQIKFISSAPNPVSLIQITEHDKNTEDLFHEVAGEIKNCYNQYISGNYDTLDSIYTSLLYRGKGFYLYESQGRKFKAEITTVTPDGFIVLCEKDGNISRYAFKEVSFII